MRIREYLLNENDKFKVPSGYKVKQITRKESQLSGDVQISYELSKNGVGVGQFGVYSIKGEDYWETVYLISGAGNHMIKSGDKAILDILEN